MPWTRTKTVRWMVAFGFVLCGIVGACVYVDVQATAGEEATFSDVFRQVWATEPWTILLSTNILAFVIGFLLAHFTAAPKREYQRIRDRQQWPVEIPPLPPTREE